MIAKDTISDSIGISLAVYCQPRPWDKLFFRPPYPIRVSGRVRCVRDHIAMVITESKRQAEDAAELADVE